MTYEVDDYRRPGYLNAYGNIELRHLPGYHAGAGAWPALGDPRYQDPRYLMRRLEHHRWQVEFAEAAGQSAASNEAETITAADHTRVIVWLEKKLAAALEREGREA